jgi:hypothetical protein
MATLRYGDRGDDVGELHQRLLERGLTVGQEELQEQKFGPTTLAAVTAFQRRVALAVDGIVGPKTQRALNAPPRLSDGFCDDGWRCDQKAIEHMRPEIAATISAALGDLGLREDPPASNRGPVEKYGAFLDGKWQPYCAAAVCYWHRCVIPTPVPASLLSGFKWVEWARNNGKLVPEGEPPRVGDVWIVRRGTWQSHVELIVDVGPTKLSLIGANVSNMVRGTVRPRHSYSYLVRVFP